RRRPGRCRGIRLAVGTTGPSGRRCARAAGRRDRCAGRTPRPCGSARRAAPPSTKMSAARIGVPSPGTVSRSRPCGIVDHGTAPRQPIWRSTVDADVVIRGGTVVDGTGAPGRPADVAVRGARIVGVGEGFSAPRELDASGQVVAPGFVDIHTHYDAQVFWDPALTPSAYHGVTSVVAGNCGFSIAPVRPEGVELLARTLQPVEDMSFATLAAGVRGSSFETFPESLAAVEARGVGLNYGCYVGHTAVRLFVMGPEAYERPATTEELTTMQRVVADATAGGALVAARHT